ncbi:MAG: hypothetical protein L6277_03725 [Desulfobacterales bacterium]|nr:hypothetical protein [Pseudomonadota bacterium]MBU4356296.1 hypothetical protein [Pseudomonadota bacterium]MCG2771183.1 hypothetical protein [Desulfobacterales bacterium]
MTEFKMSLIYDCGKCKARNFLDPYSYWEYKGNFKCGGCDALYYSEWENGQRVVEPEAPKGDKFILPGYVETEDLKPLSGPGKTSDPPFANVTFVGKPKNCVTSARGKLVACTQLTPEDLDGSAWKRITAQRKYGKSW